MTAGESAERKVKVAATAHLKFSAVLGTVSAKSSIFMRPALCPPMDTSKNTTGFPLASPGMEPTPDMATRRGARRGERTELSRGAPPSATLAPWTSFLLLPLSALTHHHTWPHRRQNDRLRSST